MTFEDLTAKEQTEICEILRLFPNTERKTAFSTDKFEKEDFLLSSEGMYQVISLKPFQMVKLEWKLDSRIIYPIDDLENKEYYDVPIYHLTKTTPEVYKDRKHLSKWGMFKYLEAPKKYEILKKNVKLHSRIR